MKLYIYEHCPFCCRARMIFGLKQLPLETEVILEGDVETPTRLIGRKVLPILRKDDGTHMGESMDIVHHVDRHDGAPILTISSSPQIQTWYDAVWPIALKLFIPRFTNGYFSELATPQARQAYRLREEQAFGDLDALLAATPVLLVKMEDHLQLLESLLMHREAIDTDDILLYPLLRSLSIVDGLAFGANARSYMTNMAFLSNVPLLFDQAA
ncbi:glutaredoxin 2 [Sphingobium yanoikuyae]|uniref:glutaredoxin 2 n=1 Tax=Sphingobium yanoikuyae TaxID=13690 RepID=UPI00345E7896